MVDSIVSISERQRFSKGIFSWWDSIPNGFHTKMSSVRLAPPNGVSRVLCVTQWTVFFLFPLYRLKSSPLWDLSYLSQLSLCYFILIRTLVAGIDAPGYASTLIILLFLGGIIELSIGIVGEYIARIFTEIKRRPIYIAKESNLPDCNKVKSDEKITG